MIKSKIILGVITALALVAGLADSASAAPLTWSADTSVTMTSPSTTLTILSGSTADTITVNAGSIDITMSSGQTFTVRSTSRKTLSHNSNALAVDPTCNDSYSQLAVTDFNTNSSTLRISVSDTACTTSTGGSSGGSGGTFVPPASTPTPTPTAIPAPVATPVPTTPSTGVSEGALIKSANAPEVYVIKDGKKVWISSAEEFVSKGYKWADIKTVSDSTVALYATSTGTVAPPASVAEKTIVINTSSLRIRNADSTTGKTLGMVKQGENYSVLEESNGWYKIQAKGVTGWVSGLYAAPKEIVVASTTLPSESSVTINVSSLRVRSSGSTAGKVLGAVRQGENYSVLEEKSGWYKIKTKSGVTGWVSGQYAEKK